jgi:hypothetical protein
MRLDITGLNLGLTETINRGLDQAAVLLAVIGPRWLDEAEIRRLHNPNDSVRLELATAFRRNIPVIPVLVGNARMPKRSDLPDNISRIVEFQAARLEDFSWNSDVDRLIASIRNLTEMGGLETTEPRSIRTLHVSSSEDLFREQQSITSNAKRLGMQTTSVGGDPSFKWAVENAEKNIDESDATVFLIGRRYEESPFDPKLNPNRLSLAELEYNFARRSGKPMLIFLQEQPPSRSKSVAPVFDKRMPSFRERISKDHVVRYFSSDQELVNGFIEFLRTLDPSLFTSSDLHDLYISAAPDDSSWSPRFIEDLRKQLDMRLGRGLKIFWNHEAQAGTAFPEALRRAINSSDVFLAIISPAWLKSKWCREELTLFRKARGDRQIIQILKSFQDRGNNYPVPDQYEIKMYGDGKSGFREYELGSEEYESEVRKTAGAIARILQKPAPSSKT